MDNKLVPITLFYPETTKPVKKYRKSRTPIKSKIGVKVDSILHFMQLVDTKRSVVVNDWQLLPARCVAMWQFEIVIRLLSNNKIKEYKKNNEKS